jgi:hypothetical protein
VRDAGATRNVSAGSERGVAVSLLEEVAREFVIVDRQLREAGACRDSGDIAIRSLGLRHDLTLLCDLPCEYCEEGTCPGLITRKSAQLLDCGHYAIAREQLRPGDEKWCTQCAQWRQLAAPISGDIGDDR